MQLLPETSQHLWRFSIKKQIGRNGEITAIRMVPTSDQHGTKWKKWNRWNEWNKWNFQIKKLWKNMQQLTGQADSTIKPTRCADTTLGSTSISNYLIDGNAETVNSVAYNLDPVLLSPVTFRINLVFIERLTTQLATILETQLPHI